MPSFEQSIDSRGFHEMEKTVTDMAVREIREYMAFHESDIAHEINDFGSLKTAFIVMIGREPSKA